MRCKRWYLNIEGLMHTKIDLFEIIAKNNFFPKKNYKKTPLI